MEVLPGRWQDVKIELENDSRSFAEHGHDPKGCDMIVCWRHNWKACPKEVMVLELRKAIRHEGTQRKIGERQQLTTDFTIRRIGRPLTTKDTKEHRGRSGESHVIG